MSVDVENCILELQTQFSTDELVKCASLQVNDIMESEVVALEEMCLKRDWWSRMWVIQEIMCAAEAVVYCGRRSMNWDFLEILPFSKTVREAVGISVPVADRMTLALTNALQMATLRQDRRLRTNSESAPRLDKLLGIFEIRRCTDPRDVIFAVVGISEPFIPPLIPDYTKSIGTIYQEVTESLIENTKSLNSICTAQRGILPSTLAVNMRSPSWVPNYSISPRCNELILLENENNQIYSACGTTTAVDVISTDLLNTLKVQSIFFDTIKKTSPRIGSRSLTTQLNYIFSLAKTYIANSPSYPTNENISQVFWRTLLHDQDGRTTKRFHSSVISDFNIAFTSWVQSWTSPDKQDRRTTPDMPNEVTMHSHLGPSNQEEDTKAQQIQDETNSDPADSDFDPRQNLFCSSLFRDCVMDSYSFCSTERGYMASILGDVEPGDMVCILHGSHVPLILRSARESDSPNDVPSVAGEAYALIGPAYVHGIMDGEVMEAVERGEELTKPVLLI